MAIQIKAIKPPRINPQAYQDVMLKELGYQADQVMRLYILVTRTWKHRPKFRVDFQFDDRPVSAGGGAGYAVTTDDPIFHYVDQGTRPHTIRARRGGLHAFQSKFSPKTRRRVLGSRQGSRSGSLVRPKEVRHPGTQAREFTQEIQKRRRNPFFNAMKKAHTKGLRAARKG